jgi:hypothetical protein
MSHLHQTRRPATTNTPVSDRVGFLSVAEPTAAGRQLIDEDVAELGYAMNVSRLWAYQPATMAGLFDLLRQVNSAARRGIHRRG